MRKDMFYNAKNGKIDIEDTSAYYISFGNGNKNLIIIPRCWRLLAESKRFSNTIFNDV